MAESFYSHGDLESRECKLPSTFIKRQLLATEKKNRSFAVSL